MSFIQIKILKFLMQNIDQQTHNCPEVFFVKSSIILFPFQDNRKYAFTVDTLKVNLKRGVITVGPEETDVVQHIALAFVTTTLYLLVQPRPKNPTLQVKRGEKRVS